MRILLWFLILILSFSQVLAYELTAQDTSVADRVIPKFYDIIDAWDDNTAAVILDKIDNIAKTQESERIIALLEYIESAIETKYEIGKYVVAESPTPVLYTGDFRTQFGWEDWLTLNFDDYWEIDALEFVALTGTVFEVEKRLENGIYQVSTKDYPVENNLFIHKDFVGDSTRIEPAARVVNLPSSEKILENLKYMEGRDYVWGGNDPDGIPEMLEIYEPVSDISVIKSEQWQLKWVDCSGLIYWATDGYTPRNTSWLVDFGTPLDIAGKSLEEITPMLDPLDIIVWKWHMMVVYDDGYTIESTVSPNGDLAPGVQIRKIEDSLGKVMQDRVPVNNYSDSDEKRFVIIRWMEK